VPELIKPLRDDLKAWKAAAKRTSANDLVFPSDDGKAFSKTAYGNWRNRVFLPAAPEGSRIYDLRHGYASLLIREGVDLTEVADRLGHSPTMTTAHYAHVFKEYRSRPNQRMETLVRKAREAVNAA